MTSVAAAAEPAVSVAAAVPAVAADCSPDGRALALGAVDTRVALTSTRRSFPLFYTPGNFE